MIVQVHYFPAARVFLTPTASGAEEAEGHAAQDG